MTITVSACSNIALVKYWGKRDHQLNLALNHSLSAPLVDCRTTTEVRASSRDEVEGLTGAGVDRMLSFWNLLREYSHEILGKVCREPVLIRTESNFPGSAGIASSASGFAALLLAFEKFHGLSIPAEHRRGLARRGSGSACRSVDESWCLWIAGSEESSFGKPRKFSDLEWDRVELFETPLKLHDRIVLVSSGKKKVSSSDGHKTMDGEAWLRSRKESADARAPWMQKLLQEGRWAEVIALVERDCLEMHGLMMLSRLFYWEPETLRILRAFEEDRIAENWPICFTIDAGPNIHFLGPKCDGFDSWLSKQGLPIIRSRLFT